MNGKITNHLDFFILLSFQRKSAISFWLSTNISFGGCNVRLGGLFSQLGPTAAEFEELVDKCSWEVEQYPSDVRGYKITGPNGNWIFLPTGGEMSEDECIKFGFYGNYWTSTVEGLYAKAMRYSIPDDYHDIQRYSREAGFNVRAVKK